VPRPCILIAATVLDFRRGGNAPHRPLASARHTRQLRRANIRRSPKLSNFAVIEGDRES
jgi:hypothetical protein